MRFAPHWWMIAEAERRGWAQAVGEAMLWVPPEKIREFVEHMNAERDTIYRAPAPR